MPIAAHYSFRGAPRQGPNAAMTPICPHRGLPIIRDGARVHGRRATIKIMNRPAGGKSAALRLLLFVLLVCRLLFARLAAGLEAADLVIGHFVLRFERPDGGNLSRQAEFRPTRGDLVVDVLAQRGALGKDRKVAVLLASVDQRLRPVGPLFRRVLS